jgi:ABC-2 type transport system permease protein
MNGLTAIAWRELGSYFRTPVGWVVIALYLFLSALVFVLSALIPGEPATLRAFFSTSSALLVPIAPAISMKLIADEVRSGTIEPLRTAPVSDFAIIAGKYAAAVGFLVLLLLPTLVFPVVLASVASPALDWGPVGAGYLSLIRAGALYLAIGLVATTLTSSQMLAFLGTLFVLVGLMIVPSWARTGAPEPWRSIAAELSITARVNDFARGLVDLRHIVFFVSSTLWLVAIAALSLSVRRWR